MARQSIMDRVKRRLTRTVDKVTLGLDDEESDYVDLKLKGKQGHAAIDASSEAAQTIARTRKANRKKGK